MKCPKCVGILESKVVGDYEDETIELNVCPMCSGIWFDSGELKKVLHLKNKPVKVEADFIEPTTDDLTWKKAKCPRCQKEMTIVHSVQDNRILLDYCDVCNGFWADGDELNQLEKGGYFKRAIHSMVKHFHHIFSRKTPKDVPIDRDDD